MRVRKAVIPAAGLGTRSLPATKVIPKEMLPIVDVPVIQHVVGEAVAAGIEEIVLVTSRGKTALEDHFDHHHELEAALTRRGKHDLLQTLASIPGLSRVTSVRQSQPLGLGHAVLCARAAVGDEPFAVLLPDDLFGGATPCIAQLLAHADPNTAVVALERVPMDRTQLYGVIDGVNDVPSRGPRYYRVRGIVEKPKPGEAPSNLALPGRYVLPGDTFDILTRVTPGQGGEIQLTDALAVLAKEGRLAGVEYEGEHFDTGTRLGFLEANLVHALRRPDLAADVRALLRNLLAREGG
jgi:UTP--glucose-1-phosphate uridylyltransferase